MEIVQIPISDVVVYHNSGSSVRPVVEMHVYAVVGVCDVDDVLPMEGVLGCALGGGGRLLHPQPIGIVQERDRFTGFAHLGELPALLPRVLPRAVVCGIANCVVGDCYAVEFCQLVAPVGVAVGIRMALGRRQAADTACCVGIRFLCQDVSAHIIGVNPGGAGRVCRGVGLIVDSGQLANLVIGVFGVLRAGFHLSDVPAGVIGIGQGHAFLCDLLDQRGCTAVRAGQIGIVCVNAIAELRKNKQSYDSARTRVQTSNVPKPEDRDRA